MRYLYSFIILSILFLSISCKKSDSPTESEGQTDSKTAIDTILIPQSNSINVVLKNKISVTIPTGILSTPAQLIIKEIDPTTFPTDETIQPYESYEVTLSSGSTFSKDLTITLNYDPKKVATGKFKNKIGAAYYNETTKKLALFPQSTVDTIAHTVTFKTNHLTKLTRFGWRNNLGYTDWYSTSHFDIYWTAGTLYSNTEYVSPFINVGSTPPYIQDIGRYLEDAYKKFGELNLSLPSRVECRVTPIDGADGESSFLGYIRINNRVQGERQANLAAAQVLPSVCAHELLHIVQDYYYMQLFSNYTTKWWLEATATQADAMVWSGWSKYEGEIYANSGLAAQLHRSWDDCNNDPNYYIAGGFLTYLTKYRSGNKLSIPQILKEGGNATDISYIRTILDNNIKANLSSTGIGQEFHDYIRCAWEETKNIKLSAPNTSKDDTSIPFLRVYSLNDNANSQTASFTLPHLSANILKVINTSTVNSKVVIKLTELDPNLFVYGYSINVSTKTFLKNMVKGDSIVIDLSNQKLAGQVLIINGDKDKSLSAKFTIKYASTAVPIYPVTLGSLTSKVTPAAGTSGGVTITQQINGLTVTKTSGTIIYKAEITWLDPPAGSWDVYEGKIFMNQAFNIKFTTSSSGGNAFFNGATVVINPIDEITGWYNDWNTTSEKAFGLVAAGETKILPASTTASTASAFISMTVKAYLTRPGGPEKDVDGRITFTGSIKNFWTSGDNVQFSIAYTYKD